MGGSSNDINDVLEELKAKEIKKISDTNTISNVRDSIYR